MVWAQRVPLEVGRWSGPSVCRWRWDGGLDPAGPAGGGTVVWAQRVPLEVGRWSGPSVCRWRWDGGLGPACAVGGGTVVWAQRVPLEVGPHCRHSAASFLQPVAVTIHHGDVMAVSQRCRSCEISIMQLMRPPKNTSVTPNKGNNLSLTTKKCGPPPL